MNRFKWFVMIMWCALLASRKEKPDERATGYILEMALDDTCRELTGQSADEIRMEAKN